MAKVRALKVGYDGKKRRQPGEEFEYDIERYGIGTWFESADGKPLVRKADKEKTAAAKAATKAATKAAAKAAAEAGKKGEEKPLV